MVIYLNTTAISLPVMPSTAPPLPTQSHIDAAGRDLNHSERGWTASRCAGICDPYTALCWCDSVTNSKTRRINAPPGSPPGTPAIQRGRPLADPCAKLKYVRGLRQAVA